MEIVASARKRGLRVEADLRNEKIGYKVREHSLAKVPVLIAVGKKEDSERTLSIRRLSSWEALWKADPSRDLGLADFLRGPRAALHRGRATLRRRGLRREDFTPLQKPALGYPGRTSSSPSSQPKAHRRQSNSRLASVSFAPRDRLLSMPALRRLRGLHLSDGARSSAAQLLERAIAEGLSARDPDPGRSGATVRRNAGAERL